jgi:hypothetical protein
VGPGLLAADLLYRHELRLDRSQGLTSTCKSDSRDDMLTPLMLIVTQLEGDAPVTLDLEAHAADRDSTLENVRDEVSWLVKQQFLALDGQTSTRARLWVNPCVAFRAGTDPRPAAARHLFPYITCDERGMAAQEPVHVCPYDEQGWQTVYDRNQEQFESPPVFPWGCPSHHGPHPVS